MGGVCCASSDDPNSMAQLKKGLDTSEDAFKATAEPSVVQEPAMPVNKEEKLQSPLTSDRVNDFKNEPIEPIAVPKFPPAPVVPREDSLKKQQETCDDSAPVLHQPKEQVVEVVVRKQGPNDKLGMDVKHMKGKLIVMQIFPGGAIERANNENKAIGGDALEIGDTIMQVNDVSDKDTTMVAECQRANELRITAERKLA